MGKASWKASLGRAMERAELGLGAALAAACWLGGAWLAAVGMDAFAGAGPLPRGPAEAWQWAMTAEAPFQLAAWVGGAASLAVGGALLVSAAEGSWWLLRRLSMAP